MRFLCFFLETIEEKFYKLFDIPSETDTRIWQRYMTHTYELLKNTEQTLSDAGIYGGQVRGN